MPTALAFETAARSFDRAAEALQHLMADAAGHVGPDTLQGGMLTLVTEATIGTAQMTAANTAAALFAKGDICRARAAACRAFAAELAAYNDEVRRFEAARRTEDPAELSSLPRQYPERPRPVASFIEV